MRRDPTNNKLTEWEARVLADIFRIMVKEITCDEDKELLAPGELGINYREGSLYIRNPHTGELFSPNSMEHLKLILTKYNPNNNTLNADYVAGIKWYSSLSDLKNPGLYQWTPDTVIREMAYPSILMAPVLIDNPKSYGWPSEAGTLVVRKINEEFVTATFYDSTMYIIYEARYNRFKHLFEGWAVQGAAQDTIYVETNGGGDTTNIYSTEELKDLMIFVVRVTETLNPGATISYRDGKPLPIYLQDGTPLEAEIGANNIIMLIYDELNQRWVISDITDSSTRLLLQLTNQRITVLNQRIDDLSASSSNEITKLNNRLDELEKRPGIINALISSVTAEVDGITEIGAIEGFDGAVDKLVVNYEQTILRIGIDYTIVGNGIRLANDIKLLAGDRIQFIVLKQPKISKEKE